MARMSWVWGFWEDEVLMWYSRLVRNHRAPSRCDQILATAYVSKFLWRADKISTTPANRITCFVMYRENAP